MGFATKLKTKKIWAKEWSKKYIFLSHFFIFHHKPKRMLKFLRNGFWIVIVQKIRKKGLSHSGKMHFSVTGHVTFGVVRWRHKLDYIRSPWSWAPDYIYPLWVLSKFGPIEAYMCRVIANWFFPSNGTKRYFNGPLNEIIKNRNIPYYNAQNFTNTKTPAYPTKRINKKRISAKDADAEPKLKVISEISAKSCFNGCLGWTGLANFLRAPSTTPFTKGWMVVSPSLLGGDPIGYCTKQILSRRQKGPQVLHTTQARSDTRPLAKELPEEQVHPA